MDSRNAIDFILGRLEKELPQELFYHSVKHTQDVILRAQKLAVKEGLSEMDMDLLLTAAAYHDSGFLDTYQDHEMRSCELAAEILPGFGFNASQIQQIEDMIMATRLPQSPSNQIEEILCDADLYYLGGPLYDMISNLLYKEILARGIDENEDQWLNHQIQFLENHSYWTDNCRDKLEHGKQANLLRLKKELKILQKDRG